MSETERPPIRVPEFSIEAGGAALTVTKTHEYDVLWTLRLPNHLGLEPTRRLRVSTFDEAREIAEKLAAVLTNAELTFQSLQRTTEGRIEEILQAAHEQEVTS